MNFIESIKYYWMNYATFTGRTSRKTFWWIVLFLFLAGSVIDLLFPGHTVVLDAVSGLKVTQTSTISQLWSLGTLVPSLANAVRRLHDTGKTWVSLLWILLPLVGWIILIVKFAKAGDAGANQFGEVGA